jgi:hypothetical protein
MTEQEWVACTDPTPMLEFVQEKASERKLRLFTVACARLVWEKITWEFLQKAVETAERHADDLASAEELHASNLDVVGIWKFRREGRDEDKAWLHSHDEANAWLHSSAENLDVYASCDATTFKPDRLKGLSHTASWRHGAFTTGPHQPNLLRDLFGNPFRPAPLDPSGLTWKDGTIPKLAQVTYVARDLPSGHLDLDRMAILGDALEDAGCTNQDILGHCRGPGPHVRGCWVVDLLLGKE